MSVPVRLALGANESGIACLAMLLASQGTRVGQEELARAVGVSRDGSRFAELADVAAMFGGGADLREGDTTVLDSLPLPAMVRWGASHSRVLDARTRGGWTAVDPLLGRVHVSDAQLREAWGGEALVLAGATIGTRQRWWSRVSPRLAGSWPGIAYVVLAGIALIVPGLLAPALIRQFVDRFLIQGDRQGSLTIIVGLVGALLLGLVLGYLQARGLQRLLTVTVIRNASRFIWHLLRMPAWFFAQRDATTLAYRVRLNEQLADVLAGRFTTALLAQLTSLFYLVVMVIYSPLLALIALCGPLLVLLLVWRVSVLRSEVRQRQAREASVTATELGVTLRMIETLKATGSESVAFARTFASVGRRLTLGYTRLWGYLALVPVLVTSLVTALVLCAGAYLVMQGTITQGTLAGFTMLLGGFLAPLMVLVPAVDSVLNLRGAWEQLNDVLDQDVDPLLIDPYVDDTSIATSPDDEGLGPNTPTTLRVSGDLKQGPEDADDDPLALLAATSRSGVSGRRRRGLSVDPWAASLTLEDVTFGYSPRQEPLLRSLDLRADAGRVVALVGPSGSGKSTIGRLIGGLYQPWSGSIQFDGRPMDSYPRESRAREVTFVNQDVVLYAASIRDNITMFDPTIRDRDVVAAAVDACVHDDITARPGGYDSILAEEGRDLSGGQRQRLVLARALVRRPRLIVLDEATSSLDARTEAQVVQHLRHRGCTVVVVAHRLSTVRDADEIIVLYDGAVVQRGTHSQLATESGLYRELMSS
ncbi:MAG: ATP-binding cassette domain-containing protein [Actinomycetota bacterium]